MNGFGEEADRRMSHLTEDVARKVSRRKVLKHGIKGIVASVAAMAIGSTVGADPALASSCGCSYPGCGHCSCRGKPCPSGGGCPSGCYICTSVDCPSTSCIYSGGSWIDSDCSCGVCGFGYYRCYDCRCTSCSTLCGCRTTCLCSGCCAPAELRTLMARDEALVAAG
jgi:hypothetical protein